MVDQREEENLLYSEHRLLEDGAEEVRVISEEVAEVEGEVQVVLQVAEEVVVEDLVDDNTLCYSFLESCARNVYLMFDDDWPSN